MSKPHEQLDAWKYAMQLVKLVYQLSADFPSEERYWFSPTNASCGSFYP